LTKKVWEATLKAQHMEYEKEKGRTGGIGVNTVEYNKTPKKGRGEVYKEKRKEKR